MLRILIIVCMLIPLTAASPETSKFWSYCGDRKYRNGGVFHKNLNKVLDSLTRNVSLNGFNISSVVVEGKTTDSLVYGLFIRSDT